MQMTSPLRSRRALIFLAILIVIPIIGAGVAVIQIRRVADRRWAAAEARIQELSAAFPDAVPRPSTMSETAKELQIHFVAVIREEIGRAHV